MRTKQAPVLERITPENTLLFRITRLRALQDSPMAFGSTYAREIQLSDSDWQERVMRWNRSDSIGYLATDRGLPCGLLLSHLDEQDLNKAHLISMWVAPPYRRSGVGNALVSAIQDWAEKRGASQLLLMVTCSNDAAIRFYERLGFSMTGHTEPYPNDSALVEYEMSKALTTGGLNHSF
jgi:ribosomal protein S18 acetylase RimI-like enzyme